MTETTARTVVDFDAVKTMAGTELGATEWREITQDMVNTFADATDDHQWIHVDPERAKDGPFGAPIAHGFLTLSLINYGLDKVRFTSPVKVGSRVRAVMKLADVQEVKGDGLHLVVEATFEIEGEERPAVVAVFLARFYR